MAKKIQKKKQPTSKKAASLEERIVNVARAIVATGTPVEPARECWALVHRVLAICKAKSMWNYNYGAKKFEDQNWGKPSSDPKPGYIIALKDATVQTAHFVKHRSFNTKGTWRHATSTYKAHIAIILQVTQGHIRVAEQNIKDVGIRTALWAYPIQKGQVRIFDPEPTDAGHETLSPTPAAQTAAGRR